MAELSIRHQDLLWLWVTNWRLPGSCLPVPFTVSHTVHQRDACFVAVWIVFSLHENRETAAFTEIESQELNVFNSWFGECINSIQFCWSARKAQVRGICWKKMREDLASSSSLQNTYSVFIWGNFSESAVKIIHKWKKKHQINENN